ncbi:ATP-dependent RNA helicase DHX8 [Pseudolycoriella hygida]|uniref:RNA helicase n=1 Tax=Pseudolycoriella hygida TaxID=35572 RepID=A0A9Q0NAY0_9DIPT|nr:ATP-dependent RNA helicase DHX8 [Pseudolycoriella hygida]
MNKDWRKSKVNGQHQSVNTCKMPVQDLPSDEPQDDATHANGTEAAILSDQVSNINLENQDDELLHFLLKYQADRDSETKKQNEEKKSKKKLLRTEKVPEEIVQQTRSLPIYALKHQLIELVKNNQFVIILGETGSGKSTQIPQYIAEAGLVQDGTKIGITQPRRVAAKSLAQRVSTEMGVKLGSYVGFAVRFESCLSSKTVIKYMTDGLLVKDCVEGDSNLDSYSVVMIDEAHDRSIHTDVAFGLLKRTARCRPDLKVIISSATLEFEKLSTFFNDAPVFNISGKSFDVQVLYQPCTNYMTYMTSTILTIHRKRTAGDILVFLTGQDEIEKVYDELSAISESKVAQKALELQLMVVPCHASLPFEDQQKIFLSTPEGFRKIVLATNIAETSITIDGIGFVIDCGFVKERRYNHCTGIETLVTVPITKFQAIQRKGRAGRTQPGQCLRMYSKEQYDRFKQATQPDIQRSNVEFVILDLLAMGVDNPLKFEFIDPPPPEAVGEALLNLQLLSAVDEYLKITQLGRQMVRYPLDPPLAKVLLTSAELGCSTDVLRIVSVLSTQHQYLFIRDKRRSKEIEQIKQRFFAPEGDHLTFLAICNEWTDSNYDENWCTENFIQYRILAEAEDIKFHLASIMIKNNLLTDNGDDIVTCGQAELRDNICKAFTSGYFANLAKKMATFAYQKLSYGATEERIYLHPSGSLFKKQPLPNLIIFHEVMKTSKPFIIGAVVTKAHWIKEYSPKFYKKLQEKFPLFFE